MASLVFLPSLVTFQLSERATEGSEQSQLKKKKNPVNYNIAAAC